MRKGLVTAVVATCVMASCRDNKLQNVFAADEDAEEDSTEVFVGDTLHLFDEESEPPVAVDELFDDFFFNFVDDAHFQSQRISFPLRVKEDDEVKHLAAADWHRFNHFSLDELYSFIYEREQDVKLQKDTTHKTVDVEWISLHDLRMLQFDFKRLNGKWMLTELREVEGGNVPNADFLSFYSQFANDSVYQRRSLADPVRLILTSEDGEEDNQEEFLAPDDWFAMRDDLPLPTDAVINFNYGQANISQNRKTMMMCGLSNGLEMKFRFKKVGDDWKLVEIEY